MDNPNFFSFDPFLEIGAKKFYKHIEISFFFKLEFDILC